MQVYSNAMKNAPQITNTWGCITTIIDYIFQDFAPMDFTKIETYDDGVAKLTFDGVNNPLVIGQKIIVTGTANYNKTFRVTDIDSTNTIATVENKSIIKGTASETGAFKMKVENCVLTKAYGSAAEQKIMIKFKNGWNLRIDDRPIGNLLTPNVTWNDTWAKFARIAIAENSNGIDNLSGIQIPYNSSYPSLNINPVNDLVGNSIFIYNTNNYIVNNLSTSNLSTTTNFYNAKWFILCDENFFYMVMTSRSANNSGYYGYRNFLVSEYDSFYSSTGKGMMLNACAPTDNIPKYNTSTWAGNTDSQGKLFFNNGIYAQQYNMWMYDDSMVNYDKATTSPMFNLGNTGVISGTNLSSQIPLTRNVNILCNVLVTSGVNTHKGIIPKLTWICTQYPTYSDVMGTMFIHGDDKYFILLLYYATSNIIDNNHVKGLVRMRIPT